MAFLVTMYMSVIINNIWYMYMKWWPSWLQCTCQWLSTTYDIWNDGLPGYNVHVSNYQRHMIYEMMAFLVTMYMSVIINNIWYMKWWPSWLQCTCQWLSTTYDIWNDGLPGYDVHVSNYQRHYDIWNDGLPGYNIHLSDYQQPEFRSLSEFYIIIFLK